MKRFAALPGPKPSFPLGNAGLFAAANQPWDVCEQLADEYGGLSLIWLLGKPALVLNDPDLIEEVLCTRPEDFYKNDPGDALKPVITPTSLFISNQPEWKARREQHPFSHDDIGEWMKAQADATTRVILTGLAQLEERSLDAPIDLYRDVQEWAFDAFSQAFWGRVLEHQFYAWFRTLADMGSKRINSKLPKWIPPLNPLFYRHRFSWYRELGAEVAKARTSHEHGEDLLRFSIRNGCPLDDESLTEAVATNFFGGVFSCSSTVITALYLLAQHPQERDRLVDALQSLPPDLPHDAVENCEPLNFVVREAMRFYPAVPLYFRNSSAQREVKLGPHTLPKDTLILISNCWLHRKSPHWEQPERFRPERWANGVAEENPIGSGHFFPFGRGPRMCIGFPFAMFFIRQALAAIYRTATVDLDPAQEYQQDFYFGVMLPKGLKARFTHRES